MAKRSGQLEQLTAYLDGELSPEDRAKVDKLLASDAEARELLEDLRRTSHLVRRLPRAAAPADLADRVHARLERAALLGESSAAMPMAAGRRPRWIRPMAAAASLLLACTVVWLSYQGRRNSPTEPAMRLASAEKAVSGESALPPPPFPDTPAPPVQPEPPSRQLEHTEPVIIAARSAPEVARSEPAAEDASAAFQALFMPRSSPSAAIPPSEAKLPAAGGRIDENTWVVRADPATAQALANCITEFALANLLIASSESVKESPDFLGQPYCIVPGAKVKAYSGESLAGGRPASEIPVVGGGSVQYVMSLTQSQLPQLAAAMDRVALMQKGAPVITANGVGTANLQLAALSVRKSHEVDRGSAQAGPSMVVAARSGADAASLGASSSESRLAAATAVDRSRALSESSGADRDDSLGVTGASAKPRSTKAVRPAEVVEKSASEVDGEHPKGGGSGFGSSAERQGGLAAKKSAREQKDVAQADGVSAETQGPATSGAAPVEGPGAPRNVVRARPTESERTFYSSGSAGPPAASPLIDLVITIVYSDVSPPAASAPAAGIAGAATMPASQPAIEDPSRGRP